MTDILETTDSVTVERIGVPMRDGLTLVGTLHRAAGGPHPVLLVRTPYSEPLSRTLPITPAIESGFAVLVQSCRGTGRSERLRTFEHEAADGLDTISWVVRQPWCTGQVCMFGMSYLGMAQLAVSGHRPEGLVAIAPTVTPDDYRDGLAYRQGAFQLGQALAWHLLTAGMVIADRAARGQDVTGDVAALGALVADTEAAYRALPLADRPALAALLPSWHTWLEREDDPDYWHGISYAHQRAATAVPALHVGGWFDLFLRGTLNNFVAANYVTLGQHLIVGPWSHADQSGVVGEAFYDGGSAQAIRLEQQQLRFLRESVDGAPTSLPPVQIYVMGANRWRTENEWPLARADWQTWHLGPDGSLGREVPQPGSASYVHDPADPVPTVGGAIVMAGSRDGRLGCQPGSRDQRELDDRTDVLRFTSAVLDRDVEVTGPLQVRLYATTSAADTDFTAKLVDVHPYGRAMGIADGIVRARYRNGMDELLPVTPGEIYEYSIDLGRQARCSRQGTASGWTSPAPTSPASTATPAPARRPGTSPRTSSSARRSRSSLARSTRALSSYP